MESLRIAIIYTMIETHTEVVSDCKLLELKIF